MAENTSDPDTSPTTMTGEEAIEAVNQAMEILPKKRLGCLRRIAKYCAVLAVLLAVLAYWNLLHTPRLRISKETTYITGPLSSDGTQVDYFAAFEQEFYPSEMKTDDNGYRLIVRALGDVSDHQAYDRRGNEIQYDADAVAAQVYEKLGLDPAIKPTMTHEHPHTHLMDYVTSQGGDAGATGTLERGLYQPWTLDDFPMMESWLEENGPILDLLGTAVRKPVFCMPLIRCHPEAALDVFEAISFGHINRVRAFARSLDARANYRIGTGDIDGAIDDAITEMRLGRHVQSQRSTVELLLGIAVEGIADTIGVAGNRDFQPTNEQLRRFVDELRAVPPPPDMDRFWLAVRYQTLSGLQAMAHDSQLLAYHVSLWNKNDPYAPRIAINRPLDWNVIMRQANASYDTPWDEYARVWPQQQRSWRDFFLGTRSQLVAEYLNCMSSAPHSAIQEALRRTVSSDNLHRIALAMLLYQSEHGSLPPAYTVDASGEPLHSWRVLLLPYLGEEELFAKIRLDEPWDSEHHRQFHNAMPAVYRCPSALLEAGETAYSVVVGEHTAFRPGEGRSLDDLGMKLVLVVERCKPVCWMDPASELTEAIALEGVLGTRGARPEDSDGIGCEHPGGVIVAVRDGSSRFIPSSLEPSLLKSILDGTAESWPR